MSASWFREGLRFSCTQCGHCCTGEPGVVWVSRSEIDDLAKFLGVTVADFALRYLRRVDGRLSLIERPNGDCIFFSKGCTVYPVRPRQCRTFPFWSEHLRSRRAWDEAAEACPGMNQGRLYSTAEVTRIRRGEADASKG